METQETHKIFDNNGADFDARALDIFRFQYRENLVYKAYADALQVRPEKVQELWQIPFLPINFFKSHEVVTGRFTSETVFQSSGTTGSVSSRHLLKNISVYKVSFNKGFNRVYGNIRDYCIIGLLPSYLERGNSSLVFMVNDLVKQSGHPQSGFYLDEFEKLATVLQQLESSGQKTLLIGVSFALLDFAKQHPLPLQHTIVIETGGMKGRRKEMIREELHAELKQAFRVPAIHSEYGMTELLSQAWSVGEGLFRCPPWMKILLRDEEDPFTLHLPSLQQTAAKRGVINIIDLANIYSCSFIATDDAGKLYPDGSFEVIGRVDNSDIRGCSLMLEK